MLLLTLVSSPSSILVLNDTSYHIIHQSQLMHSFQVLRGMVYFLSYHVIYEAVGHK